ncbi:MAG: fasciclin domain-containing protein [bacterium]|nr:fasciclin domain-containing protein [bacterium]
MRKLYVFLAVVALLAFAVVPGFAQDDPTIADIVVASTEGDPAEFTILLAAVGAADPGILESLADPEANYTVFAPTDAAFTAALETLGVTAEDLLADSELVTEILLYHVVPGVFPAEGVVALNGGYLGTALPGTLLEIVVDEAGAAFVSGAQVITTDIVASNGIIHVIDDVLLPPMEEEMDPAATEEAMEEEMMETVSIAETVVAATEADMPEFTTLLAAVAAADPDVLETLTNGGPYTVFAPTDAAFASALETLGITAEDLLADTETLTNILAYHVLPGTFYAEDVIGVAGMMEEGVVIGTLLPGTAVSIALDGENVVINGGATVTTVDIAASNGVIHVIDAVLLPPSGE